MTAPLLSLNSALVAALVDSAGLTGIVGANGVFNGKVPSTSAQKYPRVTVGEAADREALGTEGARFNTTTRRVSENIHIWSQSGRKEVLDIYGEIYDALNKVRLVLVSGQMLTRGSVVMITDLLDPDGKTTHGVAQFSAAVE